MNSRTGQAGRDSSFNSLLKVLYPVQGRSEPIRPEVETGSLQNQSLDWAPALISLSSLANLVADTLFTRSCECWRQAWWELALTNQSSRYWWLLKSLCMAINFTCFGITVNSKGAVDNPNGRALSWYARPWMWNLRHFLDCSCIGIWT